MEAHKQPCLNCGAIPVGAYCHNCGQKSSTHRITFSHLIKHDLVHGVWHFDKGLLFTLREAFLRPGYMAMDYIMGKRIKYYNVFYLILLILGLNVLVAHYFKAYYNITEVSTSAKGLVIEEDAVNVSYYIEHYFKLLIFLLIPFFAVSGLVSFRRLKLNFAEHAIIAGSLLLTGAMWYLFVNAGIWSSIHFESTVFNGIVWMFAIFVFLQPVRVYYQATRNKYTFGGFLWRMLLWHVCLFLLFALVFVLIAVFTGKRNIVIS